MNAKCVIAAIKLKQSQAFKIQAQSPNQRNNVAWMVLEVVILNEVSQKEKKNHTVLLI